LSESIGSRILVSMIDPVLRRLARDHWVRVHGTPRVTVLVGGERGREIWSQWLAVSGTAGTLLEGAFDDRIGEAVAQALARPSHAIAVLVAPADVERWRAGRCDRLAAMVDEGWVAVGDDELASPSLSPWPASSPSLSLSSSPASSSSSSSSSSLSSPSSPSSLSSPSSPSSLSSPSSPSSLSSPSSPSSLSSPSSPSSSPSSLSSPSSPPSSPLSLSSPSLSTLSSSSPSPGSPGPPSSSPSPSSSPRSAGARPVGLDARSVAEATLYEALEATPATAGRFRLNESLSVRFGAQAAEIDLLSRGDRIAIEIDGIHHFGDLDCYRRDRRKDLLLQTQGFVVVRLLAEDVMRDVRAAVNAVCQVLAYRLEDRAR
jgi:very-short-patch-repair endonuclease